MSECWEKWVVRLHRDASVGDAVKKRPKPPPVPHTRLGLITHPPGLPGPHAVPRHNQRGVGCVCLWARQTHQARIFHSHMLNGTWQSLQVMWWVQMASLLLELRHLQDLRAWHLPMTSFTTPNPGDPSQQITHGTIHHSIQRRSAARDSRPYWILSLSTPSSRGSTPPFILLLNTRSPSRQGPITPGLRVAKAYAPLQKHLRHTWSRKIHICWAIPI